MLDTAASTDKAIVAGVFPLEGVTVRKLPPVLGTKATVKGTLAPEALLVTCTLCVPGIDMEPADTLKDTLLVDSVIAEVAVVTFSVTGI